LVALASSMRLSLNESRTRGGVQCNEAGIWVHAHSSNR
jgi:hypothetical protein